MIVFLICTLLVNSLPTLVLFDMGAIQSFVSQSFSREFGLLVGELECPLRVSIANKHEISDSSVYRGCVLEIFRVSLSLDLILIPMGGCMCDYGYGLA